MMLELERKKRSSKEILKLYETIIVKKKHFVNLNKSLNDPENYDGVITHFESDNLECEVKWASGSITMNRGSGGDRIPVELFQILKENAVKVLHSIG